MGPIDQELEGIIQESMPGARLVRREHMKTHASRDGFVESVRPAATAEAMLQKWSSRTFLRSWVADGTDATSANPEASDIDVAIVEVGDASHPESLRRKTVIVNTKARCIVAVSG